MRAPPKPLVIPKQAGCIAKMLLGFVVMILMGYVALIALNPRARQWATSKKGPTPFKTLNQILAIPAMAIGKTKDVVAASDARVGVLDKVIADEEGKASKKSAAKPDGVSPEAAEEKLAKLPEIPGAVPMAEAPKVENDPTVPYSFTVPTAAAHPVEPPPPAQVKLRGGIVISNASAEGTPAAGANFLYWVVNLNISGVFQNSPHRILLDKRLVYEGQEVNAVLGVTFDHLELEKKLIVFRDKTGALVTRSY